MLGISEGDKERENRMQHRVGHQFWLHVSTIGRLVVYLEACRPCLQTKQYVYNYGKLIVYMLKKSKN